MRGGRPVGGRGKALPVCIGHIRETLDFIGKGLWHAGQKRAVDPVDQVKNNVSLFEITEYSSEYFTSCFLADFRIKFVPCCYSTLLGFCFTITLPYESRC